MSWPCGPPPRMKGYAFDHTGASPDNRGPRRGMAVHLMVETTPLGKWSGRHRTNLRLVLSSPRDKLDTRRRLLFERRSHAGSQSREVCGNRCWEKVFSGLRIEWAGGP